MTIRNLLTGTDKAIAEADKALEESLSKELNDAFANTLEANWAGTGFSTADNQPDNPMRIKNPERKLFGGVTLTNASPSKSPEDMEKEYISEAEKTIEECAVRRDSHQEEIARLNTEITIINRIINGKEAFLRSVKEKPKPKTPKETKAKT